MALDENEFFRQATLRICGNLKIEKALVKFLQYTKEFMPADRIFLERYDKGLSAMRTIVDATQEKGKRMDILTPLSQEAKAFMKEKYGAGAPNVYYYDKPHEVSIARELLDFHKQEAESLLVLPLGTTNYLVGAVVLVSEKLLYNDNHARLISLLKEPFAVAMSNAIQHAEVVKFKDMLADDNRYLRGELKRFAGDSIIGANFGLKEVMHKVHHVAALDSPVLLLGETGVGKDLIANAIHYSSVRCTGPFISVNCGGIAESLLDSELFGHEKGAFTGAISQKRGRFERADEGTIFLDEIAELTPQAQVKLLRVLQNKEIERVGGTKTIPLDIRIIAATNRDLEMMVKTGAFRDDLWFRLNVFPIQIPPLKERKTDIPALVQHLMILKAKELKLPNIPNLIPGAIDTLMEYDWPGNVRELANVVERALILSHDGPLDFRHMNVQAQGEALERKEQTKKSFKLDDIVSLHIRRVLVRSKGKIHGPGGAAELLGINPSTLRNRMNRLGIKFGRKT